MTTGAQAAVAASSTWQDEDGVRQPRGDVHAWQRGTNQTLCGIPLSRAQLGRFPHVSWLDALWLAETTEHGIFPCRRCTAATRSRKTRANSRRSRSS